MTDEDLFTYAQAAKFLNVRLGTLYALVSRKEIPHVRLGKRLVRFTRSSLTSLVAARSIPVTSVPEHTPERGSK
jgi:excisionase family DNA binding protein